jgi:hypothetical protein
VNGLTAAVERAAKRDMEISEQYSVLSLPPPKKLLQQLRAYLIARQDDGHPGTKLYSMKLAGSTDETQINLGPTIDKGETAEHFRFRSGARLSFGITVRDRNQHSELFAYRFDYRAPDRFLRFDLNGKPHPNPLREPRAHLHPGAEDIRVPTPPLTPIEVLDLLFFAVEAE